MGRASCCNCLRCTMGRASSNCLNFDFTKKKTNFFFDIDRRLKKLDQWPINVLNWYILYIFLLWQNKASIIIELNFNDESYFTNWISSFTKSLIKIFFLSLVTEIFFLNVPVFFKRYTVIHIPHWCTVNDNYNFCMMNFLYNITFYIYAWFGDVLISLWFNLEK